MTDPRKNKPAELTEEQESEVTGGQTVQPIVQPIVVQPLVQPPVQPIVQPMGFKYCAADPTHVYVHIHDACPICGCKEFTYE